MTNSSPVGAFLRFLAVGGSFSLGYAFVTAGLISLADAPPLLTSVLVYLICIPLAFWAQKNVAFRADQTGRFAMLIYAGTQVASLAVVSTITSRFVTKDFWIDTAIFLVTAGSAAVISFLICRYIIFRPSASDAR
ncbi:GtrA family protein [Cognatiyoonia sp. IB215446]|uniref:GtrA family protein n=1 Tax=Cognatiyoonia sp. IB215446 TaxID=3097355 RepID=UPI002A0F5EC8|nr:GtrA family protein [Cognatiyoonia sp. IB215446]MDX8349860.1 GtrA family protein [Cognatiyoonia sp. IB215446]